MSTVKRLRVGRPLSKILARIQLTLLTGIETEVTNHVPSNFPFSLESKDVPPHQYQ